MTFALDYDGTFAALPDTFRRVVALLQNDGHTVVLVTGRSGDAPWGNEVRETLTRHGVTIPIVFAGGVWKREAAEDAGYRIDIWIDDMPEYIAPQDPELSRWKESRRA